MAIGSTVDEWSINSCPRKEDYANSDGSVDLTMLWDLDERGWKKHEE